MKSAFWLAMTVAVVLGYTAAQVEARGGGHGGGGHHGGGHHGGGHHGGGHHGGHHGNHHHGQHHHHNAHHHAHYNGHHPFSNGWYGNHTGAWGGGYGNGLWAGATYGAAASWLGMSAASPYAYSYPQTASVYTSDNGTADSSSAQVASSAPAQLPSYVAQANQLAQSGAANTPQEGFLPLGVFSLAPEKEKDAHAMVQLAVNKDGVVRGTYYDLADDEALPLTGAIDKKTQRVAFTLNDDSKEVFETALTHLTDASGPLAVHSQDGKTTRWTLARFDKAPSDTESTKDKANEAGENAPLLDKKPTSSAT